MARVRIQYAKRGRLRFSSHRDFARAFERALRRARVPMAYSAGFTPHPKISYHGAAPTGVASEAEYLEIGLVAEVDIDALAAALDEALPPGLDIVAAVPAVGSGFADSLTASAWLIEVPQVASGDLADALGNFMALDEIPVERLTKSGRRTLDTRGPVVAAVAGGDEVSTVGDVGGVSGGRRVGDSYDGGASERETATPCAILGVVVRHATPAVRPDDVLTGLRLVADLKTPVPPRATRIAQGALHDTEPAPAPARTLTAAEVSRLVSSFIADPLTAAP